MPTLTYDARNTIKWSGLTITGYIRDQMNSTDGRTWRGDDCGCTDDRCIGHHHDEHDDCQCLPALIVETLERLNAETRPTSL